MRAAVATGRGWLGFGIAEGTIQVPVLGSIFKTPPMPYHIVYVPYYFLMLVTGILPAWRSAAILRRVRLPANRANIASPEPVRV